MSEMVKTYRRDAENLLHYREAWTDGALFHLHEGKVGTKGKHVAKRTGGGSPDDDWATAEEHMAAFVERAAADGFRRIPAGEHGWVVLQCYTFSGNLSHAEDRRLFDEGQDVLNDYLGWRGVGHFDGNDIGGMPPAGYAPDGTVMNLFCNVVDTMTGVKVVRGFAREFRLAQPWVVAAREPGEDTPYEFAWSPRKGDSRLSFAL